MGMGTALCHARDAWTRLAARLVGHVDFGRAEDSAALEQPHPRMSSEFRNIQKSVMFSVIVVSRGSQPVPETLVVFWTCGCSRVYARKFVGRFVDDDFIQSCLSGLGRSIHDDEVLLLRRGHIPFDKFTVIDRFDRDIGPLPEARIHNAVVNMRLAASAQAAEKREAEERAARFTSALQPVEPVAGAPSGSQPPAAGAPSGGAQPAAGAPSGSPQPAPGAPSGSQPVAEGSRGGQGREEGREEWGFGEQEEEGGEVEGGGAGAGREGGWRREEGKEEGDVCRSGHALT